ncbi:hypothetical protein ES703_59587 [subsurface metagenome]
MKHMFINYCQMSDEWAKATIEERKKFYDKTKESAKEHGLDLIFFGPPWGVIESATMVLTSEKSLDNYYNWRIAGAQLGLPAYIQASRTVILLEAPFLME